MSIRIRRGTNAERLTVILEEGEFGYTTDTKKLYIGDGVTVGGNEVSGGGPGSVPSLDQVTTVGNTTLNTIDIGGVTTDYVLLDMLATPTLQPGMFAWNDIYGTADLRLKGDNVTLQLGQETLARVVNKTGADLLESEYKVVRVRIASEGGSQGQKLAVVLAQGNNDPDSVTTLGIVTETIPNNQEGFITVFGNVNSINTTGSLQGETWLDGDVLYLSPTIPGSLTNIKPTAPDHTVTMGYVLYAHAVNGKIFVKVDNGYELNELHNVLISGIANNDLLQYNSVQQVWKNIPVSTAVPTPTLAAVTTAGNTTTNSISVGGLTVSSVDATINGIRVGNGAGNQATNTVLGLSALNTNSTGNRIVAVGAYSLFTNSTGLYNVGVGHQALYFNTGGSSNIAIGDVALYSNTIGNNNVGIGDSALYSNTTGQRNVAVGLNALYENVDGSNNVAIGDYALSSNVDGTLNTALGSGALFANISGNYVTAIGANALSENTGSYSTVVGVDAALNNTTGNVVAVGYASLSSNTIGEYNTALGYAAGDGNITGNNNIFIGYVSDGQSSSESNRTWIGNASTVSTWVGGNLLVGTTTNGSYKADINGTLRVQGSITATLANTSTSNVVYYDSVTGLMTYGTAASGSGTVTSVAALTLGTTGTDLSSTVANSTTTPVITLNVPTASATNRGALSSTDWSTFNSKQNAITLTTTGSSGAATFITNTLNIPNYTLSGLGGVPTSRTLTINGVTFDLTADRSWTVTAATATLDQVTTAGNTTTNAITIGGLTVNNGGAILFTTLTSTTTSDVLYYNSSTGAVTYGAAPGGGSGYTTSTVTTSYVDATTSGTKIVLLDTTSGTITVTLPSAVGNTASLTFKKVAGTASVIIDGAASETIDGGLTATIVKQYESITLISNNSNWFII